MSQEEFNQKKGHVKMNKDKKNKDKCIKDCKGKLECINNCKKPKSGFQIRTSSIKI